MKGIWGWFTGKKLYQAFIHVALLVLAIEVVVLSVQNNQLKNPSRPEQLKAGDHFTFSNLGLVQGASFPDSTSPCLIYVFTTRCPFCHRNINAWEKLALLARKGAFQLVAISLDPLDSTAAYLKANGLTFSTFVVSDPKEFSEANHLAGVPQTILRDKTGKVGNVWFGVLSEVAQTEVAAAIAKYSDARK